MDSPDETTTQDPAVNPPASAESQANLAPGEPQRVTASSAVQTGTREQRADAQAAVAQGEPPTPGRDVRSPAPTGTNGKAKAALLISAVALAVAIVAFGTVVLARFLPGPATIDHKALIEALKGETKTGKADAAVPDGDAVTNSKVLQSKMDKIAEEGRRIGIVEGSNLPFLGEKELDTMMQRALEKLPKPPKK